jgi:hypothetical protein
MRQLQLDRLLDLADNRLLKSLCKAVVGSTAESAPSLIARRERLRKVLRQRRLVEAALEYLVVPPSRELIPLSEWALPELVGEGADVLFHRHFERARAAVSPQQRPVPRRACLILPCHRLKPYTWSPTIIAVERMLARARLGNAVSIFVLSVPGFVPLEYAKHYPFAYYDWDRRREHREDLEALVDRLYHYALAFFRDYKPHCQRFVAYFRPSAPHLLAMQQAAKVVGVSFVRVPSRATVNRIIRKSGRAGWRFHGLKRLECLRVLQRELVGSTLGVRKR